MKATAARLGLWGIFVIGLIAVSAATAPAATVDERVVLPLPGDAGEAEEQALRRQALEHMARRLTGREVADAVSGLLPRAGEFIDTSATRQGAEGEELVLGFRTEALRQALRDQGVAVWLRERPPVLIWLARDDGDGRRLVEADTSLAEAMRAGAREYGIPVLWPLLDLADRQALGFQDIAGGFSAPVAEATRRYDTRLAVTGVLRRDGGAWRLRWQLIADGRGIGGGELRDAEPAALSSPLWGRIAERLREDYTSRGGAGEALTLRVQGLTSLADFAAAERTLAGTAGVTGVRLEVIEGDEARFRVQAEVSAGRLNDLLIRSPRWRRGADGSGGADLQWAGTGGGG
ncbi:DUF2066 domain-containing protein [Arhodomonas sp. SL1]|uniref:DUF2066 domain-containing protein n=1 Tax=Arhodomonas sp. SL1 TaxID=3425691 RepID=UPI003F884322